MFEDAKPVEPISTIQQNSGIVGGMGVGTAQTQAQGMAGMNPMQEPQGINVNMAGANPAQGSQGLQGSSAVQNNGFNAGAVPNAGAGCPPPRLRLCHRSLQ